MKSAEVTTTMVDGTVVTVRTVMRDMIAYETTAKRQKPAWGGVSDNPARWESFVTWSALKRTGQTDLGYEAWCDVVADIEFDFEEVPPTSLGNGAG